MRESIPSDLFLLRVPTSVVYLLGRCEIAHPQPAMAQGSWSGAWGAAGSFVDCASPARVSLRLASEVLEVHAKQK